MRWLLVKDLQILRRSPLMVGLLIVYPIAIALIIGFALSSPPGKPKVALYDAVPTRHGAVSFGNQKIDIAHYTNQLFQSITPIRPFSWRHSTVSPRRCRTIPHRRRCAPALTGGFSLSLNTWRCCAGAALT